MSSGWYDAGHLDCCRYHLAELFPEKVSWIFRLFKRFVEFSASLHRGSGGKCLVCEGSGIVGPESKNQTQKQFKYVWTHAHARIITYTCCLYNKKPRSYGAQLVRGLSYRFCVQSLLHQYLCYFSWELFHISQYVSLDGVCLCRGVL